MNNSERFLEAFKRIERHLRRICHIDRQVPFSALLNEAKGKSHPVKHFAEDLKEFVELRNAYSAPHNDQAPKLL